MTKTNDMAMEEFIRLLTEREGRAVSEDEPLLTELTECYPWFTQAKLMLMGVYLRKGDGEAFTRLARRTGERLVYFPVPECWLDMPDFSEPERENTLEIIDRFLARHDLRIVPSESAPEGDLSAGTGIDPENEMVTEALAEVYLKQGLYDKALGAYRKLSLKFPEKSVYFADIIEGINKNINV